MRSLNDSRTLKTLGAAAVAAGAVALVGSCGGGGGSGDSGTAAVIDATSVNSAIHDFGGMVAICQDVKVTSLRSARTLRQIPAFLRMSFAPGRLALGQPTARPLALTSTPPADQLGDCGGRYGYRNYSHDNGVTSATLSFEGYCQVDSGTGERQLVNGGIAFVNTATPTANGPITTKLEASTTTALTTATQSSTGTPISSQTVSFTDFKMAVGVPGGVPTAANPNVLTMGEMAVKNSDTGKTYRQTGYSISEFQNSAGGAEWTMAGRGYRSDGSYFDIATTRPIVQPSTGGVQSGEITFTGINGSKAVGTFVPGPTMQVKLSVNGTPVTSVPTCTAAP